MTVTNLFGPILRTRDVIVIDLRGTGDSAVLRCPALERTQGTSVRAAVGECAATLGPRRAFYTTRDNVADLDAVRAAIGAPQIALYGVSYGSQVALAYARSHPNRVDRLVLESVVPPGGPDPLLRSSFTAAPRVMRSFCAEVGCRSVTRDAGRDLVWLAGRLARRPLRGWTFDAHGLGHRATLTGIDLLDVVLSGDLDPTERAQVPGAVRNALRGDSAPILRLAGQGSDAGLGNDPRAFSAATFTATSCEEDQLPWVRTAAPADRLAQDRETVRKRFWAKLKRVAAKLPFAEDLLAAYYCAFDKETPRHVQVTLLGAIAYFILPFDFIPDMLPVLGFTDDAAVLATAIRMVATHITPEHRDAARAALKRMGSAGPDQPESEI